MIFLWFHFHNLSKKKKFRYIFFSFFQCFEYSFLIKNNADVIDFIWYIIVYRLYIKYCSSRFFFFLLGFVWNCIVLFFFNFVSCFICNTMCICVIHEFIYLCLVYEWILKRMETNKQKKTKQDGTHFFSEMKCLNVNWKSKKTKSNQIHILTCEFQCGIFFSFNGFIFFLNCGFFSFNLTIVKNNRLCCQ